MGESQPLPGFDDRVPHDRYCDLILTGGITSAIAYPGAVYLLGQAYRFHAIGGASSGAGAAALAAAAEYRRRRGSAQGFHMLLQRIDEIAEERSRRANLSRLFQPSRRHKRLFRAILRGVALPGRRAVHLLHDLLLAYWPVLVVGAGAGSLALWWLAGPAQATPRGVVLGMGAVLIAVLMLIGLAFWVVLDIAGLARTDYGMCDGLTRSEAESHEPLTGWLHQLIQEIAGRSVEEAPLSFGDLARAPGSPAQTLGFAGAAAETSIRLEMVAANVTLGEPMRLPRSESDTPLFFRVSEMRRLFPPTVVDELVAASPDPGPHGWHAPPDYHRLPTLELPIIVAARMSVSFPLLFTAVPLWRFDTRSRRPRLRRCLIFDGGICSNFPIHLFDSLVPAWPTFGIHLRELERGAGPDGARPLPRAGSAPWWNSFDERRSAWSRLFRLAGAMLATTKDWTDATQARLPGVRDRVITLGLGRGIGGLNVLMTGDQIRSLARQGAMAAARLLESFSRPDAETGQASGWDEHRRMRFRLAVESLRRCVAGVTRASSSQRHSTPLRELLRGNGAVLSETSGGHGGPQPDLAFDQPLREDQWCALDGALQALEQLERALAATETVLPSPPKPRPELRVRPPM